MAVKYITAQHEKISSFVAMTTMKMRLTAALSFLCLETA
jgi:hypothetical protein